MDQPILKVRNLNTSFLSDEGPISVLKDVHFQVNPQEVLGIVGESGCGKSVTSLSIMGLLASNSKTEGEILFKGEDLSKSGEKRMREIRGNEISMIFQEPMTSLNPVFTIGEQLREALRIHRRISKRAANAEAEEMLKKAGLPRAEQIMKEYPHQLSGGMRQRVMIAMAMLCKPALLIADEPTTALDVTIQAQILDLMRTLNEETKTSIIFITHDLGVVAEMCHRVIVMYSGRIVEEGSVRSIFTNPKHPYTAGLLQSVPDMRKKESTLYSIPGSVPKPGAFPSGCSFSPRCPHVQEKCLAETPDLIKLEEHHFVSCWLYEQMKGEELDARAAAES